MKRSAGILVFRKKDKIEILLVHPGGPYWQNKDENSWSIPKGEVNNLKFNQENLLETAIREFEEETGLKISEEDKKHIFYLGEVKSKNKILHVFALEKDFGDFEVKSNFVEIEWPPRSGEFIKIPEVDKAKYFDLKTARQKLVDYQKSILDFNF